jgi:hypothetical protein
MPLITCPECGAEVSTAAKACPRCGASARAIAKGQLKSRKQIGLLGKVLIGGAVASAVVVAATSIKSPQQAQASADPKADALGRQRREATVTDAASLKQALRDPDSVVFEKVLASDDGGVVCIRYRARNGFGGMDREHATFTGGPGTTSGVAWNKHCVHVALNDETDTTLEMMKLYGR